MDFQHKTLAILYTLIKFNNSGEGRLVEKGDSIIT